jgi:hypothetical protein
MRDSVAFAKEKDPAMTYIVNAPNVEIYVIDVSFQALKDKSARDALNQLPTSFQLPEKAIDRLRAAAGTCALARSPADVVTGFQLRGSPVTPDASVLTGGVEQEREHCAFR